MIAATAAPGRRRKLERHLRERVKIVLLDPECEVCGRRMDGKFLRDWNEKRVCRPCIEELTAEVDVDA